MKQSKKTILEDNQSDVNPQLLVPKRWRDIIVATVKAQVNQVTEPEDWQELLEDWHWFRRPTEFTIDTLKILTRHPACSAYLLANNYIFRKGLEEEYEEPKKLKSLAQKFRNVLHKLYMVGLVTNECLDPEEVGFGRYSVTIWITPFAKEEEIQKIRDFYKNVGGAPGKDPKPVKKTPKDVNKHNKELQVLSHLDKLSKRPQLFNHYKCPDNHPISLKQIRRLTNPSKRSVITQKCQECGKELELVHFVEWIHYKEIALYEQAGLKPK